MDHYLRLFRARQTIYEMLLDRGYEYNVPKAEKNIEHFISWIQKQKDENVALIMNFYQMEKNKKTMVFFPEERKVGVTYIRSVFDTLEKKKASAGIIVYIDNITPFAKQEILKSKHINLQVFKRIRLQFNLTKHRKVPKHRLLSKEEKDVLLLKYNVNIDKLPRIPMNDAIAQYYGAKKGQIFEIKRTSPEGNEYNFYRVVTNIKSK